MVVIILVKLAIYRFCDCLNPNSTFLFVSNKHQQVEVKPLIIRIITLIFRTLRSISCIIISSFLSIEFTIFIYQ